MNFYTKKNISNIYDEDKRNFDLRIKYNQRIIDFLLQYKKLSHFNFKLIAFINTPESDHFNSVIIEFKFWINKHYIYDGRKKNPAICGRGYKKAIKKNYQLLCIYKKDK